MAAVGESLLDVTWTPNGTHLLLVTRQTSAGTAARTRLLWLRDGQSDGQDGAPVELASLPSEVITSSHVWSPDGKRVAFVTRTGRLLSLCVLETPETNGSAAAGEAAAGYRYVADLGSAPTAQQPLSGVPALAWSPDSMRIAYAAPPPSNTAPAGVAGVIASAMGGTVADSRAALYVADLTQPPGQAPDRLLLATPDGASLWPVWRADGSVVVVTRSAANGAYDFALATNSASMVAAAHDTPRPFVPTLLARPAEVTPDWWTVRR